MVPHVKALLLATALALPAGASQAQSISPFRQAVAEAAARDDGLAAFYRARDFAPLWSGSDEAAIARRNALLVAFDNAPLHGIPSHLYDPQQVIAALQAAETEVEMGEMEVQLSRAFLAYAHDVGWGMIEPRRVSSLIKRELPEFDGAAVLSGFAAAADPTAFILELAPDNPEYARLMRARMRLEETIAAGGWGPQVRAERLDPGESGPQVIALRNRLIAMDYLPRTAVTTYDSDMVAAVMRFQESHGIATDGIVGPSTLAALNVSAEDRLHSVLGSMERLRWMNYDLGDRHVWVNLTDYTARIVDFDEVTFETKAVIGAGDADRQTPEFSDVMERMVINPSWYVPRSIVVGEYLPGLRSNSGAHGHLQIIDSRGRVVSRGQSFAGYTASSFPYSMRQPPGPSNALGQVKFLFPNQWNIYLHDTPSQSLFSREVRTFSHGCIRLDDPLDFAYEILTREVENPVEFFQARLRSGVETPVELEHEIPVHLVYFTAFTNPQGELQFRNDVYGRDARLWELLSAEGVEIAAPGS
ncbi:L,D-transpeptidase family protein [Pseudoroseicyclus tamaricis]|uniref:L,D-transpeptidase family protein n=1 Tax=Pseudoroseicyclus tamaricis TaxID=2705421 RepID=A0A6B2K0D9_9RHOB|nr:L,D-transpeptidase family protein [Pseudoroseicyclus tamaricis]NDV01142.1 L,D-transpeptidase family protein [Pseudoroseicyclus tamaricis]